MILFQYFAHDAIGTCWLSHTGTNWHLAFVSAWAAGGAFEVHCAGAVLPALAEGVQLAARLLQLGSCGF